MRVPNSQRIACANDPVKVAWLAGLLEGEASFMKTMKQCRDGKPYPTFRVALNMCDGDVVARAHEYIGVSKFNPIPSVPTNPRHKPFWRLNVHRRRHVYELCKLILPHMGQRRSARIRELIEAFEGTDRTALRHGTRTGYEVHKCRCAACRKHNAMRHAEWVRASNGQAERARIIGEETCPQK